MSSGVRIEIGVTTAGVVAFDAIRESDGDTVSLRFATPEEALAMAERMAAGGLYGFVSRAEGDLILARFRDAAETARALQTGAWNGRAGRA